MKTKIGVFDSGVGGLSVANAVKSALPDYEVILRQDKQHVPYGNRSSNELLKLVTPIFQELVDIGCSVIVIACNTVSTTLYGQLSELFDIELIAVEPMVEAAAASTKTGIIAVCATPTTLSSKRYAELKLAYASKLSVVEPDCSLWALMIEHNKIEDMYITETIDMILEHKADVIVLGCTHYHWIEDKIMELVIGKAIIIQPEKLIIKQLKLFLDEI